ncbi:MAG: site-specific integrase [Nitrosopumilaceae archaeon]
MTPGSFKDRYQKVQPKDLLTDDEILQLIQATKRIGGKYVKRNIAIIFVLLEGAYRPGELLDIRISGIEFEKDFVRIHTTGKTGPKSLTLVASFEPIREWLAEHPYSNDPDAFLFYHDNADGLIPYQRMSELIKKARHLSGIKKRIWPYLFRHTALTEYSKKLGNVAKIYGNWSRGSNMLAVYEHLANSDQEDAILKLHGLKKENTNKSILFSKSCPYCHVQNSSDKHHCTGCGKELSEELVKLKEARREANRKSVVENFEGTVSKKIENLESLFVEQQKLIQSLLNEKANRNELSSTISQW